MKKKTALITGGASGIGKKTAFYLAENGYQLAINYRKSKSEAISLANQLTTRYGTKNIAIQGDVSNKEDCIRIVNEVLSSYPYG